MRLDLKDGAVDSLTRFVLSRLMIALIAIGLVSAPQHAIVPTAGTAPGMFAREAQMTQAVQSQPDHQYGIPSKSHATELICCYSACVMAVVPALAGALQALPLSEIIPILPDLIPVAAMASGIDRPPKRA